ncbi:MAG: fasciclin domain-containing protein [Actinobacteria bacterium]|nr:fasciclin domain-containing protein [Actinomycetota bacterium]
MRNKTLSTIAVLVLGLGLLGAACSSDDKSAEEANSNTTSTMADMESSTSAPEASGTIVDVAAGNPDFSTLVELVTAAGLGETLSGTGPFTVFAPTNEAFAAVPASTLEALAADPTGALTDVLKLHVITGKVDAEAATAAAGTCVETLGGEVKVEKVGEELTVGGVPIVATDVPASNGVVHVLGGVITEPSKDC